MKSRLVAILLLACLLLLVGLIPAVGAQPVVPEGLTPPEAPRQTQPYRPPVHTPQRETRPGATEDQRVPLDEPVDPRRPDPRAAREAGRQAPHTAAALPLAFSAGPLLPITDGPERIPGAVQADSSDTSLNPSVSTDGRYTAFYSSAQNLVAGDNDNHQPDVFVYDSQTGILELVSVPQGGGDIWGYFYDPSISDDGRFVAFSGWTNDIAPPEYEWSSDIYVLDRNDGSIVRVSDAYDGSEADGNSYNPVISPDGGHVAFSSYSTDLVPGDTNGSSDVFLHDIAAGTTERVSVSSNETESDDYSSPGGVSLNGEIVSFYSYATNLVANDTNGYEDVFVRDVANGTTERVSVADGVPGAQGNSYSYDWDISANGRYVAFESDADNLVANDGNYCTDIFVRDRLNNTTQRVSLDENGDEADDCSYSPSLSGDGLTVAFETYAGLVAADTNGESDIYTRNWQTGAVIRATVDTDGNDSDNYSYGPSLAADASVVAFVSYASDLVAGDENETADVYLRELPGGPTTWVSADSYPFSDPNDHSYNPAVSGNGRYVAFESSANNLVPGYDGIDRDIFLYDRQLDELSMVSIRYWGGPTFSSNSYQPGISDDGNRITFLSYEDYIVDDDDNGFGDIFVYDRSSGSLVRVSVDSAGNESNEHSESSAISGDGNVVAFMSYADNLTANDNNGAIDIFVHDLTTGDTTRVSVDSFGIEGNSHSYGPALSEDGRYVAFVSDADNLADNDFNGNWDVFVHDRVTGTTSLVSVNIWGESAAWGSAWPSISADGRYVAFESYSYDLIEEDNNGAYDVFMRDLWTGRTARVSHAPGGGEGNSDSFVADISADGRFITFQSWATNLIADDTNDTVDAFLYDRLTGQTARLSESAGGDEGNSASYQAAISADGTTTVFASEAANLVPSDTYGYVDIFAVEQAVGGTLFSISGAVLDEDRYPMEGVMVAPVAAPGNFALTDANGEYSLVVPAGAYDLAATLENDNYWFTPETQTVTVGPNRSGIDFEVVYRGPFGYWLEPTADAYVDEAYKTKNYGSASILRVKNAATDMNAYLKYEVAGFDADPGQCYIFYDTFMVNHVKEPSVDGGDVYSVGNNWTEGAINWNNAPPISGSPLGSIGAVTDETSDWAYIGVPVSGNGVYSFAIHNNSTNSVDYSSKEGQYHPWLFFSYRRDFDARLTANFYPDRWSGLAPMTVRFNDESYGCPTSWEWDFGDGSTSTERNPTHTYTAVGDYSVTLTVTNSQGSDTITKYYISVVTPPDQFYISPSTIATIGGIPSQPADILLYDKPANHWTMVYDGSTHGTLKNITAFGFDGTDLLLTFSANQVISGLGTATPYDVVRFTPDDPWTYPLGTGTYTWYFQGRANGLTTTGEKIDAFDYYWSDSLFSTVGAAALPTTPVLKAADEDLFYWLSWAGGWNGGLYLDGSTITGLAAEDINGLWYDEATGDHYITILGAFNLGGVAGNQKSIVRLSWNGNGYTPSLVPWLAPGAVFPSNIDAIELGR